MTKRIAFSVAVGAAVFLLLYAMCALCGCSWNPCRWSATTREVCSVFGFCLPVLAILVRYVTWGME